MFLRDLELDSSLKRDHAGRTVPAESDAQQAGGRRDGAGQRAKARLRCGFSRSSSLIAGQREVGMVEGIEDLRVQPEIHAFGDRNPLRQIDL